MARLEEQLKATFEGPAWHVPAVLEVLAGLSAALAAARPIAGAQSIWELTQHLGGTYRLVLRRLDGDPRNLAAEEDWPPLPAPTEEQWRATIDALRAFNASLRQRVREKATLDLDAPLVADPTHSAFTQLVGITQHDLYHAGQIALLKRAMGLK